MRTTALTHQCLLVAPLTAKFTGLNLFWSGVLAAQSQNKLFDHEHDEARLNWQQLTTKRTFTHTSLFKTMKTCNIPGFMKAEVLWRTYELKNACFLVRPWASRMFTILRAPQARAKKSRDFYMQIVPQTRSILLLLRSLLYPKQTLPSIGGFKRDISSLRKNTQFRWEILT